MTSLNTEHLTRRFGSRTAVGDLTLSLPADGVIGLVGPNGSGKSTLIRMLLALVAPDEGSAHVLGHSIDAPGAYLDRVGSLVESPAFLGSLSARRNLLSLARSRGLPTSRVGEVLDSVGLAGRDREPVRRFSLGMKQRLGIAAALLPDPALLLLDEPTNGLDPLGVIEMRALLRSLARDGRAVVVSSHHMHEIEAICDWLVVLRFGDLLYSGPIRELLDRTTEQHIDVVPEHPRDLGPLREALEIAGWQSVVRDVVLRVAAPHEAGGRINRSAADAGILLTQIVPHQQRLEDVFVTMTTGAERTVTDEAAAQIGPADA